MKNELSDGGRREREREPTGKTGEGSRGTRTLVAGDSLGVERHASRELQSRT